MPRRNRPTRRPSATPPERDALATPSTANRPLIRALVRMRREQPDHPRYGVAVDVAATNPERTHR